MEKSPNFNFNLPYRGADNRVDVNQFSDNFKIIDTEIFKMLKNKIEKWQPDTEYVVGDIVLADVSIEDLIVTMYMRCKKNHISPSEEYPSDTNNFSEFWSYSPLRSYTSESAIKDANGNIIHDTYANKKYVDDAIEGIQIPEGGGIVDQTFKPESENAQSGVAISNELNNRFRQYYTNDEVDEKFALAFGKIETALDNIIAIQNSLIGGGSV